MKALSVLLLCDYRLQDARMVSDHIDAFTRYSRHRIEVLSNVGHLPHALDLSRFDAVVVHYSLYLAENGYVPPLSRERLRAFDGTKVVFIHDEYRTVDRTIEAIRLIRTDLVFTCIPPTEIAKVYDPRRLPGTRFINVLTGYIPERLIGRPVPPYAERPIDIGYRGRVYPAWHGEQGRERVTIAQPFIANAQEFGLRVDISVSEADRVYGEAWDRLLASSKATLGTESGSSVFDFTGEIDIRVRDHLRREPHADYETLRRLYFAGHENKIDLRQISPRCFEAIAARSMMILYEGKYSGILEPWRHYVPLAKDHSNFRDVIAVLKNPDQAQAIIDRAYREVLLAPQYSERAMIRRFDDELAAAAAIKPPRRRNRRPRIAVRRKPRRTPRVRVLATSIARRSQPLIEGIRVRVWFPTRHAAVIIVKWLLWLLLPAASAERIWSKVKQKNAPQAAEAPAPIQPISSEPDEFELLLAQVGRLACEIGAAPLSAAWDAQSRTLVLGPHVGDANAQIDAKELLRALHDRGAYRVSWAPGSPLGISGLLGPAATATISLPQRLAAHEALSDLLLGGCVVPTRR